MELLIKYLGTGKLETDPRNSVVIFITVKISDINKIIIPFFYKNPLVGIKLQNYIDWCKIVQLINLGSHLTIEGLELIRSIKSKMNTGRKLK
jgi:hypothetical protein